MLKIIVLKTAELEPVVQTIADDYREMQKIVGGTIDCVYPKDYGISDDILAKYNIVINDEGLLERLPLNIALRPDLLESNIDYAGILVGDIFVTGLPDEEGRSTDVLEEDIPAIIKSLKEKRLLNKERALLKRGITL